MKHVEESPLPCHLLPNGLLCHVCQTEVGCTLNNIYSPPSTPLMDAYMSNLNLIVTKVLKLYTGPSYWKSNCLLCFLVSHTIKDKDLLNNHHGHSHFDCFDPRVLNNCPCSVCFGTVFHSESHCAHYRESTGLCSKCLLPQKLGSHWFHSKSDFGFSCKQKSFGRLLWIYRKYLEKEFGSLSFVLDSYLMYLDVVLETREQFHDSLATVVNGVPFSITAYLFMVDMADKLLDEPEQ